MATSMCVASVNNVKYSKIGGDIARVASDSAHAVPSYKDARSILMEGLDAIIRNPRTTIDEQALASMGVNFGGSRVSDPDAVNARYAVMSAIAQAMPGSIGQVIAGTALKAYENVWNYQEQVFDWRDLNGARTVLNEGFDAIIGNLRTTIDEQALASMGVDVVGKGMDDISAISASLPIMKKIAGLS